MASHRQRALRATQLILRLFERLELVMKKNVGSVDSATRIVTGVVLIGASLLGFIGAWGWLGLIPLATGVSRVCPAYLLSGFSTRATKPGQTPP